MSTNSNIDIKLLNNMPFYSKLVQWLPYIKVVQKNNGNAFRIKYDGEDVHIEVNNRNHLFRALCVLSQYDIKQNLFEIEQKCSYKEMGLMLDTSRNSIPTVETVKILIEYMACMGFNTLMLYTEDTYTVDEYPYFGYMRGRYSKDEIRQIDKYAKMFGIELCPCIQTLAHLGGIFNWTEFAEMHDNKDILLVGEEKTYELIEAMLNNVKDAFSSKRIHIGLDEAWTLGQGNYLTKKGYKPRAEIMAEHVEKVAKLCSDNGLSPMMWSDMFFRNGDTDFEVKDGKLSQAGINKIPENVTLVHWDYVSENKEDVNEIMHAHKLAERDVMFAGGAWRWVGFAPFIDYSLRTSRLALECCRKNEIDRVLLTVWSDGGGEASWYTALPVMQLYAEDGYTQNTSDEHLSKRLKHTTGMSLKDALLMDLPHALPGHNGRNGYEMNPATYLLYQDLLTGLFDKHVNVQEFQAHYSKSANELSKAAKNDTRWWSVYQTLSSLCRVLEIKSGLGVRIKQAYDKDDKKTMKAIVDKDIKELLKRLDEFYIDFRNQWDGENKPFGFETHDIRLGGLIQRVKHVKKRLNDYVDERLTSIPELEEEKLYFDGRQEDGECIHTHVWHWKDIVTVNVL